MNNALARKSITMLIVMSIIASPMPVYGQINIINENSTSNTSGGGTFSDGMMAGQMSAKGQPAWLLGGFLCGIFGVGGAYLIEPTPPTAMLIGKSADYVMGFTEAYKTETKKKNVQYATIGCLGGLAFNLFMSAASSGGGY